MPALQDSAHRDLAYGVTLLWEYREMETAHFGDGVISLVWSGVEGEPGLQPRLVLIGKLTARDFGLGAVAQVSAEVTALDIVGTYAYLGAATPQSFPLMWVRMEVGQANPRPQSERSFDVRLMLPLTPTAIEQLEQRRGGKNFTLQVDVTVLLIDRGERNEAREHALIRSRFPGDSLSLIPQAA